MKIRKDNFGNYYLIMKEKDKLRILAEKNIKSSITVVCKYQRLSVNMSAEKRQKK